jgi:hypothetical protein
MPALHLARRLRVASEVRHDRFDRKRWFGRDASFSLELNSRSFVPPPPRFF